MFELVGFFDNHWLSPALNSRCLHSACSDNAGAWLFGSIDVNGLMAADVAVDHPLDLRRNFEGKRRCVVLGFFFA